MPVVADLTGGELGFKGISVPKKGFFGTIGTGIFDLLDAPGNITRSGIRFAQTGDPDYLLNIAKNILPFTEAERIGGEEITGGPVSGLLLEVVADPLLFANSLGGATKIGKSLSRIADLGSMRKAFLLKNKAADAARIGKEIAKEVKRFQALKKVSGPIARKSIIELGLPFVKSGIEVGDATKLYKTIQNKLPIGFLPDARKPSLLSEADRVGKKLFKAEESGNFRRASILSKDLAKVESKLAKIKPSLLPRGARTLSAGLKSKFARDPENKLVQALGEITETEEFSGLSKLAKEEKVFLEAFEDVRKAENIESLELLTRMTRLFESRQFRPTGVLVRTGEKLVAKSPQSSFAELDQKLIQSIQKLKKKRVRALKKANIIPDEVERQRKLAKIWVDIDDEINAFKFKTEASKRRLNELVPLWGKITPGELGLIENWHQYINNFVKAEQNVRIGISSLKTSALDYMRRLQSPEMIKLKSANKIKHALIMNQMKTRLGAAIKRKVYPELEITGINKIMKKEFGINFNVFDENPIRSIVERKREHITAIHRAKTANIILETFGRQGVKGPTASQFLEKMGLTGNAIGDLEKVDNSIRVPSNIVDMATRTNRLLQKSIFNDRELLRMFSAMESINAPFKILLTSPFGGFHNRNMISNWFLNGLGGVRNPKFYIKAAQIQHKRRLFSLGKYSPDPKELKLFEELDSYKISGRGFYDDLFRNSAPTEQFLKKWTGFDIERPITGTIDNLLSKITGKEATRNKTAILADPLTGRAYGQFIEDNARIAHYLSKRSEGLLPFEAKRSVNKYLFDYSKLTNFEKEIMRPTFLFYTWMRNNLPLMINTALTRPRVVSTYGKITNIGPDEAPDYLRASSSFPSPFSKDVFVGTLGLPLEDLNSINVDDVDPLFFEQAKRLGQKIATRLSPALKIPYELLTGESAFSRRKLSTMESSDLIKQFTPLSRAYRESEKLLDPDETTSFKLWNALVGARTYRVLPERARLEEAKRQAVGTGKFRREGFLTLPKRGLEEDEEVLLVKDRLRELRKNLARRKRRK